MLSVLLLLAQIKSVHPPVEHPGAGGAVDRGVHATCGGAIKGDRAELLKHEADIVRRVNRDGEPASGWTSLGCARALLYLSGALSHDGPLMVAGDSWDRGAEHAFEAALRKNPADARAATGLAVLAMNDAEPNPMKEISTEVIAAAEAGVQAAPVLSGCADLAYRTGRFDQSERCAKRALAAGVDSTWNLLRLTRLAFRAADTVAGNTLFEQAAQSAHDSITRLEISWQLQWFVLPEEQAEWNILPDSARGKWVLDRLRSRDIRDGQPVGARLAEHFNRLDYVDAHFRMRIPRVMQHEALTGSMGFGVPTVTELSRGVDTTIFREYNRWQVDISDAGVIWMAWGKPSKIAVDTVDPRNMLARESWRYDIDGKSVILTFQGENFNGSSGATTLQAGVVGEFQCVLDAWRCSLALMGLRPEDRMHVAEDDRKMISFMTSHDDNSVRSEEVIDLVSRMHRLWDPVTATPIALLTYAVKSSDVAMIDDSTARSVRVNFEFRRWDASNNTWQDTTFTKVFPASGNTLTNVTGFMVTPSRPTVSSWSLVATQSASRRGRAFDVSSPPLDQGPIVLSDLVLGQQGQGVSWINHNVPVVLAPLNSVDRAKPVSLYFQVQNADSRTDGRVQMAFYRVEEGVVSDSAALRLGFDQSLGKGINEIAPTLDITRLNKGTYRLDVRLSRLDNALLSRRQVELRVQ